MTDDFLGIVAAIWRQLPIVTTAQSVVMLLRVDSKKLTFFLLYIALDVTANYIYEIHCLALDGFKLNTVHKLSSKMKKS